MRCDATEADARVFADLIRELAHHGALDLVDALRQASSVQSEEIAVRLVRRLLTDDLEIECTICGAGRAVERATDRCRCGAAGWDPAWTVIPIRDATWSTREDISTSIQSPILRHLLAPAAAQLLASVAPVRTKRSGWRTFASLAVLAGAIILVATRPRPSTDADTDGIPWWTISVAFGVLVVMAVMASAQMMMVRGRPRALVVEMADRVVVLTDTRGLVVRASDAATFVCRRARTTLLLGGLDERGEPLFAASCRARGDVLDRLQRELESRLPIRASAPEAAPA
jgi:hypothetical protein